MMDRRRLLGCTLGAGAALALGPRLAGAAAQAGLQYRAIPSSRELVPVIGLGSSATFRTVAQTEDVTALREVLDVMIARGATVFDTAPSYGASEEVAGRLAREQGSTEGYRTIVNTGRIGRQDVMHLHVHVLGGADPLGAMIARKPD